MTGLKSQMDIKTQDELVLRSVKTTYQDSSRSVGPWKVYSSIKVLEQTDMIENDTVARSNAIVYKYDDCGNILLQYSSETQLGELVTQSWKRCSYKTIDGVIGVSKTSPIPHSSFRFSCGSYLLSGNIFRGRD
jgi:hypothetical protein